jgi:putative membrane-bound dehydrogenase-like protein
MTLRLLLSALLLSTTVVQADPLLSPEEARKKMTVPEGFSVDLIAAEPDIVQPIAFCWDARGRIWVVQAKIYPARRGRPVAGDSPKPSEAQLKDIYGGDDSILIFADEDGDGKFETRKVFAEHLNLVSGIEIGFGGVYVGAAPYLLHIPDKDGDDKPDGPPEILLDGWGYQDTHETLNSFIWGPDGWLYGCHGVFTHSNVGAPGTPKEKRTPLNCAYWRYHPVRKTFDIYASGTSNSWGFDYNEYGDWFSEACVIPHFWHIIQGGYYLRQSNPLGHFNPYVYTNIETIADHLHYIGNTPHSGNNVSDAAGGGHAHCGLCIYNGDNFPPEYRGRPMLFNIHGKRINQQLLVPEGSGYVAKAAPDFLKANDANFTGVALKVGPDGAVYFIDWYDKEKCHRPQKEVWDRSNGRIYRVKYDKTWKPWKGNALAMQTDPNQAEPIYSNGWLERVKLLHRAETKWQFVAAWDGKPFSLTPFDYPRTLDTPEYKEQYVKAMHELAESDSAITRFNRMIAEGGTVIGESRMFLESGRPVVRAAAVREMAEEFSRNAWVTEWVKKKLGKRSKGDELQLLLHGAGHSKLKVETLKEKLLKVAKVDPSPAVRLSVASALQRLPLDDRWPIVEALIAHGEDAKDHNLPQMYWYAIEPLVPANPDKALDLAARSQIPLVSQNIARRLAETDSGVPHLITALGKEKTAAGAIYLLKAALQGLKGRSGEAPPKNWDGAYTNIDDILKRRPDAKDLATEITDLREALAVAFGDKRAFPRLREQVKDAKLPVERRELALQTLLDGKDSEIRSLIQSLLDDPVMRLSALKALPAAMR